MDFQEREDMEETQPISDYLRYKINYCSLCGTIINHTKFNNKQTNICFSCKKDMNEPFDAIGDIRSNYLICNNCAFPNPPNVNFCAKCGSSDITHTIAQVPNETPSKQIKNPFFKSGKFFYIISFIISLAISIYVVVGIASKYLEVRNIIAAIIILSFAFILSGLIFVIISAFTKKV